MTNARSKIISDISSNEGAALEDENSQHDLLPLTHGEIFIAAINTDNALRAAAVLRQVDCLTQPTLSMLADLLDGDVGVDPTLAERYPYRLETASWGLPGRKRMGAGSKAKSPHKRKTKSRPSDAMITAKVRTKMDLGGMTKAAAVAAIAEELGVSLSLVKKACNSLQKKMRASIIDR